MEKYITIKDIQHFLLENDFVWKGEVIEEKLPTYQNYIYEYKYKKATVQDFESNYNSGLFLKVISLENKTTYEFYVRANSTSFVMRTISWQKDTDKFLEVDLSTKWSKYLLKYYKKEYSSFLKNYIDEAINKTDNYAIASNKNLSELKNVLDAEEELSL